MTDLTYTLHGECPKVKFEVIERNSKSLHYHKIVLFIVKKQLSHVVNFLDRLFICSRLRNATLQNLFFIITHLTLQFHDHNIISFENIILIILLNPALKNFAKATVAYFLSLKIRAILSNNMLIHCLFFNYNI